MRLRISIRGCVRPSVGPSVGRSVPSYFQTPNMAVFEGKKVIDWHCKQWYNEWRWSSRIWCTPAVLVLFQSQSFCLSVCLDKRSWYFKFYFCITDITVSLYSPTDLSFWNNLLALLTVCSYEQLTISTNIKVHCCLIKNDINNNKNITQITTKYVR